MKSSRAWEGDEALKGGLSPVAPHCNESSVQLIRVQDECGGAQRREFGRCPAQPGRAGPQQLFGSLFDASIHPSDRCGSGVH